MKYLEQYKKENPHTKGEIDKDFERYCYIEWIEEKHEKLKEENEKLKHVFYETVKDAERILESKNIIESIRDWICSVISIRELIKCEDKNKDNS